MKRRGSETRSLGTQLWPAALGAQPFGPPTQQGALGLGKTDETH